MLRRRTLIQSRRKSLLFLGLACITAAIFASWGAAGVIPSSPAPVLVSTEDVPTDDFENRNPFLVVLVAYGMQSCIAMICLASFSIQRHRQGSLAFQLENVRNSLWSFLYISTSGFLVYSYFAFGTGNFMHMKSVDGGIHLGLRNLFWMFSTPGQWYCFAKALSTATNEEIAFIFVVTLAMQSFGFLMLVLSSPVACAACFIAACIAFAMMFHAAFQLPLLKELGSISHSVLHLEIFSWAMYPTALCLRTVGWIDPWCEQVLIYSVLDILTKTITMGAILMTQFTIVLTGAHEALEAIESHSRVHQSSLSACDQP